MSEEEKICKILISLQASSDPQPEIHEVSIDISEPKLKLVESKTVQEAMVNWLEKDISVQVPEPKQEGENLPDVIESITKTEGSATPVSTAGSLKISQLEQNGKLQVVQVF